MTHTIENKNSFGLRHGKSSPAREAEAAIRPAARPKPISILDRLADGTAEEQAEFLKVFFRGLAAANHRAMQ